MEIMKRLRGNPKVRTTLGIALAVALMTLCIALGFGLEQLGKSKDRKVMDEIKRAETLPVDEMRARAMRGDPYAQYAWGMVCLEKAMSSRAESERFDRESGLYAESSDGVDHALLTEAGKLLLSAAEKASDLDDSPHRHFVRRAKDGLRSWRMEAASSFLWASIPDDRGFMRRIDDVLDDRRDALSRKGKVASRRIRVVHPYIRPVRGVFRGR